MSPLPSGKVAPVTGATLTADSGLTAEGVPS